MFNVAILAPILQFLFTTRADELARQTHFIQRQRAFTGADFLQALVFGYLKRPTAPLEDLAQPLGISRQALDQRFTPAAALFCKQALAEALGHVLQARPQTLALLDAFEGTFLDDCTQLRLPDDAAADFPGCGAGDPAAAKARMKVLVRWEIERGQLCHLHVVAGRTSDHTVLAQAPPLPAGCLHLADLGFLDLDRLQAEADGGIFWISRLPAQTRLEASGEADQALATQLQQWRAQGRVAVDTPARVGDKTRVQGRLVALACPQEVVARRLQKLGAAARRRGRTVSARQRELCHWTVLFTTVPCQRLTTQQVWLIYRLRWQIELLFKRFKTEGGLDQTPSAKRHRVETEWYVKLLGQVVRNWLHLLSGGPLRAVNQRQLGRVIADGLQELWQALRGRRRLRAVLRGLAEALGRVRPRTRRKTRQTATELLEQQGASP